MANPLLWGPTAWKAIFYVSANAEKADFCAFIHSFTHILPCSHCRKSYAQYVRSFPPERAVKDKDRETQLLWAWASRDFVNTKLGKMGIPFSILKDRLRAFPIVLTSEEISALLCFAATQIETIGQIEHYMTVFDVLRRVSAAFAEQYDMKEEEKSPATAWIHALKLYNSSHAVRLSREEALNIFRGPPQENDGTTTSRSSSRRSRLPTRGR